MFTNLYMFPAGATTIQRYISGSTNIELVPAGENTLLGISMQQGNTASQTELRCGTTVVATNYSKDLQFVPLNYYCASSIRLDKTGQDTSSIILTYIPRDLTLFPTPSTTPSAIVNFDPGTTTAIHNSIIIMLIVSVLLVFYAFWNIGRNVFK